LLLERSGQCFLSGGIGLIAIHQSGELLQVTINGECTFAVTQELLLICKTRLHEGEITRIEILLEKVTSFNSCAMGAMVLLAEWVHGNFQIYVDSRPPPLSSFSRQ